MTPFIIALALITIRAVRADSAAHAAEVAKRNAVRYAWIQY